MMLPCLKLLYVADLVLILLLAALFGGSLGFIELCRRLMRQKD